MIATVRTRCSKCNAWNSFEADDRIDAVECGECAKPIGLAGVSETLLKGEGVDCCCRCGASASIFCSESMICCGDNPASISSLAIY